MSTKILIVGPAASGKTTLANKLKEKGFSLAKLHTTRPMRNESDNEYYFDKPFIEDVFVSCDFNGWTYALTNTGLIMNSIFIIGPKMAQMIKDRAPKYRYLTIFLDIPESIRYERLMQREMPGDTVIARIGRDRADFAHFTDYDIRIHENHAQQADIITNAVFYTNNAPC